MKKILLIFLVTILNYSCTSYEIKKELLGTWNNFPTDGLTELRFYQDSVISYENFVKRKGTWKADSLQIKFHFPKKLPGYHVNLTLDYKLKNDSLLIKNIKDSIYIIPPLLKIYDNWEHYIKEFDLKIELPKADFEIIRNDSTLYGIDLYIGFKDNDIITKSFRKELLLDRDVEAIVFSERALRRENEEKYLFFNLIIDKRISEKKVDSIKQILNRFPKMKVFRVYEKDNSEYGKYDFSGQGEMWNWYGRYE